MNILLMGPQGSGKGTQAEILLEKLGLSCVEMGGILREAAKKDAKLDKIVNVEGKLVPDEMALKLVIEKIKKISPQKDGILFDGFPRSVAQYEMLSSWLGNFEKKIDVAILIDIPDKESIRRLSARRKCAKCGKIWNLVTTPKPPSPDKCECGGELTQRKDDTPEAISNRLKAYHETTGALAKFLEEKGLLVKVDGTKSIEGVTYDILAGLENWE